MKESKKETGLWIKNNTSVNKSNTKMDKEISRKGQGQYH